MYATYRYIKNVREISVRRKIIQNSWKYLKIFQKNDKISKNTYIKVIFLESGSFKPKRNDGVDCFGLKKIIEQTIW